ncbi:hypothetical protein ABC767_07235 [Enterobacter cloacae]
MSNIDKQALRQTAEKAQEHGVFNMDIHSQTVLELLDELEAETSYREGAFIACNLWHDKFRETEAKLEAAEKRIADLEATASEPVAFRSKLKASSAAGCEHWDYTDHRQPDAFELENCMIERLYTAPPAPECLTRPVHPRISSEELDDETLDELIDFRRCTFEYHSQQDNKVQTIIHGVTLTAMLELRDRRAAMLHGADGNSSVIQDGWVMVPVEPTYQMCEAMGLPWESPRFPDRYKAMIAAAQQQEV